MQDNEASTLHTKLIDLEKRLSQLSFMYNDLADEISDSVPILASQGEALEKAVRISVHDRIDRCLSYASDLQNTAERLQRSVGSMQVSKSASLDPVRR